MSVCERKKEYDVSAMDAFRRTTHATLDMAARLSSHGHPKRD